jgi:hypothetical protein
MKDKFVIYNGVKMMADWPARIEESQRSPNYTCKGKKYPRVRYGDDDPRWGETPCRDCGVQLKQFHVFGCEYEQCPVCGNLIGGCECGLDELLAVEDRQKPVERMESRGFRIFVYGFFIIVLLLLLRVILMLFGI